MRKNERKGIRFYDYGIERVYSTLSDEQAGILIKAVFATMFGGNIPKMDEQTKVYYNMVLSWQDWGDL